MANTPVNWRQTIRSHTHWLFSATFTVLVSYCCNKNKVQLSGLTIKVPYGLALHVSVMQGCWSRLRPEGFSWTHSPCSHLGDGWSMKVSLTCPVVVVWLSLQPEVYLEMLSPMSFITQRCPRLRGQAHKDSRFPREQGAPEVFWDSGLEQPHLLLLIRASNSQLKRKECRSNLYPLTGRMTMSQCKGCGFQQG